MEEMCSQSKIKLAQAKFLNALFPWGRAEGYGGVIFILLESHLEENLVFFKTLLFLGNTLFRRPIQAKRANQ